MEQIENAEKLNESSLEYYFDQEREINLFYRVIKGSQNNFLELIYQAFPELTDLHKEQENLSEKEMKSKIREVLLNFRGKYADNIVKMEDYIKSEVPKIKEGINCLEDLMGEEEHYKYLVMPSVFPVCPFDAKINLFYFTITGVNKGFTWNDRISSTTLHEISHFIFFRQLEKIEHNLSYIGVHHLKEVLTPVLLQHPDILKYRQGKYICGNRESVEYQVEIDGKVTSIFYYVNSKFQENPTKEGYMPFLLWLIRLFERIEPEVLKRDEIFTKNGRETFNSPTLKEEFMRPIHIG